VIQWTTDLNRLYRAYAALHQLDCDPAGFEWVGAEDKESSVLSFLRRGSSKDETFLVVLNFTPIPRMSYRVGVPYGGTWRELANSDATVYGGSGIGNLGAVEAEPIPSHGRAWSLTLTLPPLACLFLNARLAG
jgi:1,4-alpha-glucan branching enzyme